MYYKDLLTRINHVTIENDDSIMMDARDGKYNSSHAEKFKVVYNELLKGGIPENDEENKYLHDCIEAVVAAVEYVSPVVYQSEKKEDLDSWIDVLYGVE